MLPETAPDADDLGAALARWRVPLLALYAAIVLLATLTSFRADADPSAVAARLRRLFAPPLTDRALVDAVLNVLLFAGWGLLWVLTALPGRERVAARHAALSAAALSTMVEVVQLFSRRRTASIVDIFTNTGGAFLGAVALAALATALVRHRRARGASALPLGAFALAYGLAVAFEALVPAFRRLETIPMVGDVLYRMGWGVVLFRWSSLAEPPFGDVLLFAPAGALAVAAALAARVEVGIAMRAIWLRSVAWMAVAEISHGPLYFEVHGGAYVTHVASIVLGAWLAVTVGPRVASWVGERSPARMFLAAYVPIVACWALRPFVLEASRANVGSKLRSEWWIPMEALTDRADMFSVTSVLIAFLLYAPVGIALAISPLGRRPWTRGIAPAVALAGITTLGQFVVADRTPDVTLFVIQVVGAAVGWTLARRAGLGPEPRSPAALPASGLAPGAVS